MRTLDWRPALQVAHDAALDWLEHLPERPIRPEKSYQEMLEVFGGPVPEVGETSEKVVASVAEAARPGLMAMNHARFFGWVIGGAMPAGVATDWLVAAWDQNTAAGEPTPAMSAMEAVTAGWLLELLDLPRSASVAFVTGAQMANLVCLAAARERVLTGAGWHVAADGLIGAPPVTVLVGDYVHQHGRKGAADPRSRGGSGRTRAHRRERPHARRCPAVRACRRNRADDRLCPGWGGEHRRRRPDRRDRRRRRRASPREPDLASRRWRDWTLRPDLAPACAVAPRRGAGRLVLDGRAQVAEHAIRLRDRHRRGRRRAPAGDDAPCRLPAPDRFGARLGWAMRSWDGERGAASQEPEGGLLELQVNENGGLRLFSARATDVLGRDSAFVVIDALVFGLVWRVIDWARTVAGQTGFVGNWRFGVALTKIAGARSPAFHPRTTPFEGEEYEAWTEATYAELVNDPDLVVERLVGRLNRALSEGTAPLPRRA